MKKLFTALAVTSLVATELLFGTASAGTEQLPAAAMDQLVGDGAHWALIVNAGTLTILQRSFNAAFRDAFAGVTPEWNKIATEIPSATSQNDYAWLGEMPGLREWIGDRHVHGLMQYDYSIKNKDFELTVGVPRTAIEDDQYGVYTPMMSHMGDSAARHPDELTYGLLAAGFATECYDGQNFFDAAHPVGEGTVSNTGGGAGQPWFLLDTSRFLKPVFWQNRKPYNFVSLTDETDDNVFMKNKFFYGVDGRGNAGFGFWQMAYGSKQDLTPANYAAARAALIDMKGEHGRPLGVRPNLLVVNSTNEQAGREILMNERDAAGATNPWRNTAELLVSPWF